MDRVVLTLLLSIFSVGVGIWISTQDKSESLTDTGGSDIFAEEFAKIHVNSIEIPSVDSSSKEKNADDKDESKSFIIVAEADTIRIDTINEYASYYGEKIVGSEDYLFASGISLNDTPVVHIPEKSWPDSNRIRRELTLEIAKKYPTGNFVPRRIVNNAWGVGEQLSFSIDYGFYRAGTAIMAVVGTEEVNGGLCYQIRTTASSNKFISTFYKVRDTVRSFIDVEGVFSRRIEKVLREGRYKSDRFVDFYHDRLIALNTREKYALTEIPLYTQDILSSLYLIRTYDLEVGKDETIIAYADGKVYPLRVIVHKIENVKVPAGEFKCFKVEPVLKSEGIFRQKGRLIIWLTNDERKMPVKMKSKVIIGSIGSNLEKYSLGEIE